MRIGGTRVGVRMRVWLARASGEALPDRLPSCDAFGFLGAKKNREDRQVLMCSCAVVVGMRCVI